MDRLCFTGIEKSVFLRGRRSFCISCGVLFFFVVLL